MVYMSTGRVSIFPQVLRGSPSSQVGRDCAVGEGTRQHDVSGEICPQLESKALQEELST